MDRERLTRWRTCGHAAMAERLVSRGRAEYDRDEAIRLACEAVIHRVGESAGRLSDAFVMDFPELRLRAFTGMRNLVAHRYQHVDYEIIWEAIAVDVPRLDLQVTKILQRV